MVRAWVAALVWLLVASSAQSPASPSQGPKSAADAERLAGEMLRFARVRAGDVVYDFGSAAVIPILAARRFRARAVGVGLEAAQVESGRSAAREQRVAERVRFVEGGLLTTPFSDATVVTLDLTPSLNLILEPILRRELRPGARIVSHRYGIGAWRADATQKASDGTTLFLWTVPRPPAHAPDIFFVPTEQRVVEQLLDLAGVTAADVVYDLGSGDGRIPVIAAQKYGARSVGVEIDPALVEISRRTARDARLADKVRFIEGDLFQADVSEATVVTLFLSGEINRRLEAKLKRELKPGARVVSHQFAIGDWTPDRTVAGEDATTLFLWTIRQR